MAHINIDDPTVAAGVAGGIIGTAVIAASVVCVFLIIAMWKIFTKAGEKGWKSLIPIYNVYVLYRLLGLKKLFWYTIAASVIYGVLFAVSGVQIDKNGNIVEGSEIPVYLGLASLVYIIFAIYVDIKQASRLSKAFGKSTAFTVGLVLLEPIFILILGFDKSKYDKKIAKEC